MIVSLNWLKKFTDIDISIDELKEQIGARLVEVEGVKDLTEQYKDVRIVRVVECAPLEGTDHLNLTKVDDGGIVSDVERDDNGLVQVVCGAPNVRAGMFAAWLPPQSIVPETFATATPFVLTAKNLRGVVSNGMLASARELALYDDHEGIVELSGDVQVGDSFSKVYGLDDYLIDIENKSLTHRPDTFGIVGFAREIAALQGRAFRTPEWMLDIESKISSDASVEAPKITIDDAELSDRFEAIVLADAKQDAHSPLELQTYLSRSGVRPISPIVDITNYLMLLTGQPLHAYDYDKLLKVSGGKNEIHVRSARSGETLELLDGRTVELDTDDIVIAAGDVAVGLGGAMGGRDTEIDSTTTRILLECATFNLYKLRNMQMRHGIFTEAITRLTKGIPAQLGRPVLAQAVKMMHEVAGLQAVSEIADTYPGKRHVQPVELSVSDINSLLGTAFTADEVQSTLQNAEFEVSLRDTSITVTAPYWRTDIHIPEDIVEEVGRLNGYDNITPTLPVRDFTAVSPNEFDQLRGNVRSLLIRAGANEVLTYGFVHGDILTKAGQKPEDSYKISNSISPDLQYYRQSLTPSLLTLLHPNSKAGYDSFALFEFNKIHPKQLKLTDEEVPEEADHLGYVITAKAGRGAPYYQAKTTLDFVLRSLNITPTYDIYGTESHYPTERPFEYRRSAKVVDEVSGETLGIVGEYKKSVQKAYKLSEYTAGFELDTDAVLKASRKAVRNYQALSRYPSTERDICFKVAHTVSYSQILAAAEERVDTGVETIISPVDIYQSEDTATKNITIRVRLTANDKTLTGDEVSKIIAQLVDRVVTATNAEVV